MGSVRENLSPEVLRSLGKELSELSRDAPEGIKVHLNDANITDIQATIFGSEGTPYAGGQFRIRFSLPNDFPTSPPKGFFITKVFHPNVATPSGEICVNTLKKDWEPSLGIKHILVVVKCLLIHPNPESALNEEAGKLIMEDFAAFERKARMITKIHAIPKSKPSEGSSKGPTAKHSAADKPTKVDVKKRLKRL